MDRLAKEATDEKAITLEIIEGGLKQKWKAIRASKQAVVGFRNRRVPKWSKAVGVIYIHIRTKKGIMNRVHARSRNLP